MLISDVFSAQHYDGPRCVDKKDQIPPASAQVELKSHKVGIGFKKKSEVKVTKG